MFGYWINAIFLTVIISLSFLLISLLIYISTDNVENKTKKDENKTKKDANKTKKDANKTKKDANTFKKRSDDDILSFLPPGVTSTCFNELPDISFSNLCHTFTKEKLQNIMQKPKGVCLFDVDGTLSVKPSFIRNKAVSKCLENDYAVGVITAGGYRNAYYFCEKLELKNELPCLCDFFSVNKGTTFFQNQPLISDMYCYSSCQGDCANECLSVRDDMSKTNNKYDISKHTIAKTCALKQVYQMYPHLEKKCIALIDNEHSWTCYSENGEGCAGFGGQWSPHGTTDVDITNLIYHCENAD
jgi:hypothetical protein